jgi:signal transduction histidine kinase
MKRTVLVVILATAALALLASLALQSRSVPVEVHVAQNAVATEVDRINEDFRTLVATLESAWQATQDPGEGAHALEARLAGAPERLRDVVQEIPGSGAQLERIRNSYDGLTSTSTEASALALELLDDQAAFAKSLDFLRDSGPRIIQQMRDIRLDRVAADTFQLIVGTVDYASPESTVQEYELRRLLVTLGRDQRIDANMPAQVQTLRNAVDTVLSTKASIRSKLDQLAETPVVDAATGLGAAVQDSYRTSVAKVDQARLMLAIYAVVLLAAVGFVAYGLQSSYRDLNRANAALGTLNESLEQRVHERTAKLTNALAELKESQVQLVQAEKMSSLGQLVAGISHEINTPLLYLANNAILLQERIDLMGRFVACCLGAFSLKQEEFADRSEYQAKFVNALRDVKLMLRDDELEANFEEARDLARDSIEGLGDLTEIAQSLKDFSRLDRAPVGSFDVNAGLDKTLVIARNIVKHKADVHKFYGEIPEVACSPSQINQVFLNLITNAAQAMDGHGEIVITTKQPDADHVAIAISDTGCGIPEENLNKIRDPFFTTKEVGTGTGLGLSIVDEIIRSHGGRLLVESQLGHGSTFTVVLPIKQTAPGKRPAAGAEDTGAEDADSETPAATDASPGYAEAV